MKNLKATVRAGLLVALVFMLINCKKENVDIPVQKWNYTTFTDARDGKTYKTIKIGTQEWMAENLAFKTPNGSWSYWGSDADASKYGLLYNWEAAKLAVPAGWHLPTDAEWKQLEMTLGMSQTDADGVEGRGTNQSNKLRSVSGWAENKNGTDDYGFAALPGGFRSNSGSYLTKEYYAYWWSSTASSGTTAWFRQLVSTEGKIYRNTSFIDDGYSVRCIKN